MTEPRQAGIEWLTLFSMPPLPFVELAGRLGCRTIGLTLESMQGPNPYGHPAWSLRSDPELRRDLVQALADHDVAISIVEGFQVSSRKAPEDLVEELDLVQEIGGTRINATSSGRDIDVAAERLSALTALAADRGIEVVSELGMGPAVDLTSAVAVATGVGRPDFRILLDAMHYFRLGGSLEELAGLDPSLVGYVQLCDVPLTSSFDTYLEEAYFHRLPPGEGELPLVEFLRLLPADVPVSMEIPQRTLAEAGEAPEKTVAHLLAAARGVLAQV